MWLNDMQKEYYLEYLTDFLRNPRLEVYTAPADELVRLRDEVARLQLENARISRLYADEVVINLRLQDRLAEFER